MPGQVSKKEITGRRERLAVAGWLLMKIRRYKYTRGDYYILGWMSGLTCSLLLMIAGFAVARQNIFVAAASGTMTGIVLIASAIAAPEK
jgi:hypothetical protein